MENQKNIDISKVTLSEFMCVNTDITNKDSDIHFNYKHIYLDIKHIKTISKLYKTQHIFIFKKENSQLLDASILLLKKIKNSIYIKWDEFKEDLNNNALKDLKLYQKSPETENKLIFEINEETDEYKIGFVYEDLKEKKYFLNYIDFFKKHTVHVEFINTLLFMMVDLGINVLEFDVEAHAKEILSALKPYILFDSKNPATKSYDYKKFLATDFKFSIKHPIYDLYLDINSNNIDNISFALSFDKNKRGLVDIVLKNLTTHKNKKLDKVDWSKMYSDFYDNKSAEVILESVGCKYFLYDLCDMKEGNMIYEETFEKKYSLLCDVKEKDNKIIFKMNLRECVIDDFKFYT